MISGKAYAAILIGAGVYTTIERNTERTPEVLCKNIMYVDLEIRTSLLPNHDVPRLDTKAIGQLAYHVGELLK